jgi:hypothetical protein
VQRKPGALRNGTPFLHLPEPLQKMRRALLREERRRSPLARVLALVPAAGLDAVLVAVELALEGAPPAGRLSAEQVVSVLARLNTALTPVRGPPGCRCSRRRWQIPPAMTGCAGSRKANGRRSIDRDRDRTQGAAPARHGNHVGGVCEAESARFPVHRDVAGFDFDASAY